MDQVIDVALLVIAKEPIPGRVKTRLTPPCSPGQAAALAGAALTDTLDRVARMPVPRKILVFDGDPRCWQRDGFELISQRGSGLDERLAAAFADVPGAALLVGMDTPQLTEALLDDGLRALSDPAVDAVLGRTDDGGYWSLGLKHGSAGVFSGIPMSCHTTWRRQRARLRQLRLRVHDQPLLRDVDTIDDACAVALQAPNSRFAATLRSITG